MKEAKAEGKRYEPETLDNGDTRRELLVRSRYLLYKSPDKWSPSQKERAKTLFREYPSVMQAYTLSNSLRQIFNRNSTKDSARLNLARWYNDVEQSGIESFQTIMHTIYMHYDEILNYYTNRSTNASAEQLNSKIKAFRKSLRGVQDLKFFFFPTPKHRSLQLNQLKATKYPSEQPWHTWTSTSRGWTAAIAHPKNCATTRCCSTSSNCTADASK